MSNSKKTRTILRIGLIVALAGAIAVAAQYREALDVETLAAELAGFGWLGPVVFAAVFAAATVLFLPGAAFGLAGGALFGPVWGVVWNLTGATVGATLAFLAARYVFSDWAEAKAGGRMHQLKQGVENEGWRFVAVARLVPMVPFNLLNYALGLTRIPFAQYVTASAGCMLPGTIAYTYLGYAGREAVAGGEQAVQKGLLALGLLAVVAYIPRLASKFRKGACITTRALNDALKDNGEMPVLDVRDAEDFNGNGGHIPGALNIPLPALEDRIGELAPWRDKPLAVVCRTNRKSGKAVHRLRAEGFSGVLLVDDGMVGWQNRGYATERKPNQPI